MKHHPFLSHNDEPQMDHLEETISTCRFAQRCAQLSTNVLANEEVDPDQLVC
jgi:hypothetical protein